MLNDGVNNVPDKTIAVFPYLGKGSEPPITKEKVLNVLKRSEKKRNWFTPHFYRCLPLTIGNQYGFYITSQFDFSFFWDGNDHKDSVMMKLYEETSTLYPRIETHFGSGILTINPPFILRTPPGVNLMTINPPNHVIPNITVMTGVIETDNLRRNFTFNLKIQIPNIEVFVPKGSPLAAFIPIPRYYADKFDLKFADELFSDEVIQEELDLLDEANELRSKKRIDRTYLLGEDVRGNKFKDHQGTTD